MGNVHLPCLRDIASPAETGTLVGAGFSRMRFKTWPVAAIGLTGLLCHRHLLGDDRLTTGAGDLRAARRAEHVSPARRDQVARAARGRAAVRDLRSRLPARYRPASMPPSTVRHSPSSASATAPPYASCSTSLAAAAKTSTHPESRSRTSTATGRHSNRFSTGPSSKRSTTARRSFVEK